MKILPPYPFPLLVQQSPARKQIITYTGTRNKSIPLEPNKTELVSHHYLELGIYAMHFWFHFQQDVIHNLKSEKSNNLFISGLMTKLQFRLSKYCSY